MQCPVCGRRFRQSSCPVHGTPYAPAAAPAAPPPAIPTIAGYRDLVVIGAGGFGTVYAADGPAGRVAIKTAHATDAFAQERLRREGAALEAIGPPHVPRFHESGALADGTGYIVMELLAIPTLAERLADRDPLPVEAALPIARAILSALAAAHAAGLLHRDLKPENIFVGEDRATIVDFGLVKRLGTASEQNLTLTGMVLGSSVYMSPEQCAGSSDIDSRCDVYSFAVVLYEMLAGRPPFLGSAAEIMQAHLARRPPRPSSFAPVPPRLEELILRCLAKRREDRPPRVAEIDAALAALPTHVAAPAAGPPVHAGAPRAPTTSHEKRTAGLLFFRCAGDVCRVQQLMDSFGGQLARGDGSFAAVFDHTVGENPVRRAFLAGQAIVDAALAETVIIDTAAVTVLPRPAGGRRYVSPLFTREDQFPVAGGPRGVLATPHSAELLGDVGKHAVGLRDLYRITPARGPQTTATAIVGRDRELAELAAVARGVRSSAVSTVIGEAGVGKSCLLAAAAERVRDWLPDVELVHLGARGHADGPLRRVLRQLLELPAEPPADAGRAFLAARLGYLLGEEVWPGVAVALGWARPDDEAVRALASAPGALRSSAARAVAMALRGRAADHPVAVFVDDAHLLDKATLDGLELATLAEAAAPIWLCVSARPAFATARADWGARAALHRRVELAALGADAAGELCRRLLEPAENVPGPVIERLVARTQGLPLLIAELVRGFKREGLVRRQEKGATWYLASDALERLTDLPLIDWVVSRELAALSPDLARHARLLALLGGEVATAEVAGVLQELDHAGLGHDFPLDAAIAIRWLVEAGVLVALPEADRWAFRTAVVREAILRATPAQLAQPIHDAAYRYHRATGAPESLPALADHAAQRGLKREAFGAYVLLAERAAARHAYLDAESFLGRALEQEGHGEDPLELARVLRERGLLRYRLTRYDEARRDLGRARELAGRAGDRGLEIAIDLDEATVLDWQEEWHASRDLVERARKLSAEIDGGPGPLLEARLAMGRGRSACRFAEYDDAARLLLDAAARSDRVGDEAYETLVIALLLGGWVLATLGRLEESRAAFDRVVPLTSARHDQLHLGAALACRNTLWAALDQPRQAADDLGVLLGITRELGNVRLECAARQLLALSLHYLGRYEDAEAEARRAIEVDDRLMGAAARPESRIYLARILAVAGKTAEAAQALDDVHARQEVSRANGGGELLPMEATMLAFVELLVRGGSVAEWDDLEARARKDLNGQDLGEAVRLIAERRGAIGSP